MPTQVFSSEFQWNLYGSTGRDALGGRFTRRWRTTEGVDLVNAELVITGAWLDRSTENATFLNLKPDFAVTLSQVIMEVAHIESLLSELAQWLTNQANLTINLCPRTENVGQKFELSLGPPRIPSSLGQVLVSLRYSGISFTCGRWDFTVDQSGIRILLEEMQAALDAMSVSNSP